VGRGVASISPSEAAPTNNLLYDRQSAKTADMRKNTKKLRHCVAICHLLQIERVRSHVELVCQTPVLFLHQEHLP